MNLVTFDQFMLVFVKVLALLFATGSFSILRQAFDSSYAFDCFADRYLRYLIGLMTGLFAVMLFMVGHNGKWL